jgi:hypothetical protein
MKIQLLIITLLGLIAINVKAQQSGKNVSMQPVESDGFYENIVDPAVFSKTCKVYAETDTSVKVIDTLKFAEKVRILSSGYQHSVILWYKVEIRNGVIGYVLGKNIARHVFPDNRLRYRYFFVQDKDFILKAYKYDDTTQHFMDSFTICPVGEAFYKVHELSTKGLKNMDMLFSIDVIRPFCGGDNATVFVADASGKMFNLIKCELYGEEDDMYSSSVYLPVTFAKGRTFLIYNGDVEHIFDPYDGKLRTISFPKNISFPKSELFVKKIYSREVITDTEGNPVRNKNGKERAKIKNATEYYRWNGNSLKRVKLK